MPIIPFASGKGGTGKTTNLLLTATELAEMGTTVTILDADPNQAAYGWSLLPNKHPNITVIGGYEPTKGRGEERIPVVNERTLKSFIDEYATKSAFVLIDLEGSRGRMVLDAVGKSDFVVIPLKGSANDAIEADNVVALIKDAERVAKRKIPHALLYSMTSAAYVGASLALVMADFRKAMIPAFQTQIVAREAYISINFFGGGLMTLPKKGTGNIAAARQNALLFIEELVTLLRNPSQLTEPPYMYAALDADAEAAELMTEEVA